MWIRGAILITCALIIDGLQAVVAWAALAVGFGLQAITPAGGAVAGGAAGAYYCWNSTTGVWSAVAAAAKCGVGGATIGAAVSALGIPIGTGLGFALDICISLTLGSAFILLLFLNGMFYPMYIWAVFIGETIPGLDVLPGWTLLAIRCVMKKAAEEKAGIGGVALGVASAIISPQSAASGLGSVARGIMNTKAHTASLVQSSPDMQLPGESEPGEKLTAQRQQLLTDVGREIAPRTPISKPTAPANDNNFNYVQKAA